MWLDCTCLKLSKIFSTNMTKNSFSSFCEDKQNASESMFRDMFLKFDSISWQNFESRRDRLKRWQTRFLCSFSRSCKFWKIRGKKKYNYPIPLFQWLTVYKLLYSLKCLSQLWIYCTRNSFNDNVHDSIYGILLKSVQFLILRQINKTLRSLRLDTNSLLSAGSPASSGSIHWSIIIRQIVMTSSKVTKFNFLFRKKRKLKNMHSILQYSSNLQS